MRTSLPDIKHRFETQLAGLYSSQEIISFFHLAVWHRLQMEPVDVVLQKDKMLSVADNDFFCAIIEGLKHHRPIQYLLGKVEFLGTMLKVNASVLIPRPETEEMVRRCIEQQEQNPKTIIDIGTGSGAIAIALTKQFTDATVYGLDISKDALTVATENATNNNVSIEWIHGDILSETDLLKTNFDIIISNPPYVRFSEKEKMQANVLEYEPYEALFVPDENPLMYYEVIARFASHHLSNKGQLCVEINEALGNETIAVFRKYGFENAHLLSDFREKTRFIFVKN